MKERTCIVVSYALFDQVAPDFAIVDFSKTDVDTTYCGYAPRESPACTMEHGECPKIFTHSVA